MKTTLLGGVAAIAMFAVASGATPVAAQEPFDWTGFYIGAHVGAGEADYDGGRDLLDPPAAILADDLDIGGIAAGGHVGFNYQFDSPLGEGQDLVVGIEGDATWTDWRDAQLEDVGESSLEGIIGDVNLLASVRARLGVAFDDYLVYATGGVAFSDADYTALESADSGSVDFNDIGGVVGGGIEVAAVDMLSVRLEGLYYIFDDRHDTSGLPGGEPGDFAEFDDAFVIRVGVSIQLGGLLGGM